MMSVCFINDIPQVDIDSEGGYKFILVEHKENYYVWAEGSCEWHRDILANYNCAYNIRARCEGGGRIAVDPIVKTIEVWGVSGDFGRPDYDIVKEVLQKNFPDYQINPKEKALKKAEALKEEADKARKRVKNILTLSLIVLIALLIGFFTYDWTSVELVTSLGESATEASRQGVLARKW